MLTLLAFLVGLLLGGLTVGLLALYRRVRDLEGGRPYWLRNGMEDVTALNVRALLRLKAQLSEIEDALEIQNQLVGQIRNGEYRKEQPAAPRRGNGKGKA